MRNRWYPGRNRDLKVEWDFDDRLVKVTKGDGTVVENVYDVDGVLVRTVVNGVGTEYLVDTSGGLSHVVAEIDGSGVVGVVYVRAGDMLLEEIRGGVAKMYEADGLGSTRSLLDATGAQTDTWSYEAFGTTLSSTGSDENPYRFAGERFVGEVGMYQNRARWLDTRVGRFVSVDPLLDETGMPYGYAAASPASKVDPTGEMDTLVGLMVAAGTYFALEGVVAAQEGTAAASAPKRWTRDDIDALADRIAQFRATNCGAAALAGLGPNGTAISRTIEHRTSSVAAAAHGIPISHNIRFSLRGTGFSPDPADPDRYLGNYRADYVGPERPADLFARLTGTGLGAGVFLLGVADETHSAVAVYSHFGTGEAPYWWLDQWRAPGHRYELSSAERFDEYVRRWTQRLINEHPSRGLKPIKTKLWLWQIPPR